MITLRANAKINLSLDVLGKRKDGYHELDMVMQSVSLFDTVTVAQAHGIRVSMDVPGVDEQRNTAYTAAKAFCEITGCDGASIAVQKRIPSEAGLGGSSADAAAVLIGLNHLYQTNLSDETLSAIGVKIGADVPFALTGGTVRAGGIGEKLRPFALGMPMHFTVVKPHAGVSTPQAFAAFKKASPIRMDSVQYALTAGDLSLYHKYADNALGMAALSLSPDIMRAADALKKAGARKAMMSGSGSAMFAVFASARQASEAAARVSGDFEHVGAYACAETGVQIMEDEA